MWSYEFIHYANSIKPCFLVNLIEKNMIETNRLKIYAASQKQMEMIIVYIIQSNRTGL